MFLLVCAAGMSTSLLVNRMKEAAETKEIEFQIEAHPVGQIEKYVKQLMLFYSDHKYVMN